MAHLEYKNLSELQDKLEDFLEERHLVGYMQTGSYPITYMVKSSRSLDAQLSMLEEAENGIFGQDARIVFIFEDGEITFQTIGHASLPDADLSKIKSLVKKLHYAFLQVYYLDTEKTIQAAEIRARKEVLNRITPIFDTTVGNVCLLRPAIDE